MTPLLLLGILSVVRKMEYEYIKKVLKMKPITEKEVNYFSSLIISQSEAINGFSGVMLE